MWEGPQFKGVIGAFYGWPLPSYAVEFINELFYFQQIHYLQIQGTAMGTRMAPSYANLFMGKLEQEFLLTQDRKPREWWRYTDDIFAIWTHGEPALCTFVESLNHHHATIKFTATWSTEEVVRLDTRVYLTH